jgi:hypothetical protein
MKTKRKFARAKDRTGKKKATVDVTNSPDTIGRMLNDPKVGSVEVTHQGGRKDAYVKVEGVRATSGAGKVTVSSE